MLRVWLAVGAVIAIVFGSLAYSACFDPNGAIYSHISHDFIPPFRG
jgi:hypothetical protein